MRRSLILDTVNGLVFHTALLVAFFLLLSGHNRPGGGFVGGLVAGAAFALRYVAGGTAELRTVARVEPWAILGTGMVLATATTLAPLLGGDQLMDHAKADVDLGPLGVLHLSSALVFDLGVALVVVSMVLLILGAFGERMPDVDGALGPGRDG